MAMFTLNSSSGVSSPIGSPGGASMNSDVTIKVPFKQRTKIGIWNVRTMAQPGKIQNAIQEMRRIDLKILGISEMRWTGANHCDIEDFKVYYSGLPKKLEYGVGIIVHKSIAPKVRNFVPINERIMLIQMEAAPVNINILQVYAPTSDHTEEEINYFYTQIASITRKIPKKEVLIVMGDFNAKVGQGRTGNHIGPHGLGERNKQGDKLSSFAGENDLVIMNTFFELPPRRLYTWTSPQDGKKEGLIVRNQIDYVLINQRYRNSCKSAKTYPGADINSDHNLLVAEFRVQWKKLKTNQSNKPYDYRKLKNQDIKKRATEMLKKELEHIKNSPETDVKIDMINTAIKKVKTEILVRDPTKKKSWMTTEILELMEERRIKKQHDKSGYKIINTEIRRKIREAKELELKEKCAEIEMAQRRYDSFNVHKKVREITGKLKKKTVGKLENEQGEIIIDINEIKETWKNYVEELFADQRNEHEIPNTMTGPDILVQEVEAAIRSMKDGKAPGPDEVQTEILKLLEENFIIELTNIYNNIYNSGIIPHHWLKSEFIVLPKKQGAKRCSDYRTISLMSHMLKLFLKIMHKRLYRICEEQVSPTQFGFMKGLGTRDALFSVQVLFQRCRDMNCNIFACFIDYQKAFDKVKHNKMMEVLQDSGMDGKDLRIIKNLYWNQSATIKINQENTDEIKILQGVRQGCIISPLIFNLYSEAIFQEALENMEEGILLNGKRVNNFRYADDTIIFADTAEGLQHLMDKVTNISRKYGLEVNISKTKSMIISKEKIEGVQLIINNKVVERVKTFTYLGTTLNEDWDHSQEIKCRIEKARSAFNNMSKLFKTHNLTVEMKMRLLRCYIFSIMLYGIESWTLTGATTSRLEAFEMWIYRRILRISWMDRITNESVLQRMKKDKEIMHTIKRRKLEYLGHILRNENKYHLLKCILQGKVYGKRGVGRRRISWLKNLRTWFATSTTGLFKAAANKIIIARMIANIR
uniref:Craniofacial development protein 2 n=1 Tax=Cacopsylla melanoneura TaxID=428564 RepID=A0A8D8SXR8_9HEMI